MICRGKNFPLRFSPVRNVCQLTLWMMYKRRITCLLQAGNGNFLGYQILWWTMDGNYITFTDGRMSKLRTRRRVCLLPQLRTCFRHSEDHTYSHLHWSGPYILAFRKRSFIYYKRTCNKTRHCTKKIFSKIEGKGVCINCSLICLCFMVVRKNNRNRSLKYFGNAFLNKA